MDDLVSIITHNGVWIMIIFVVAIPSWLKYRERELRIHQELRQREMEHQQKMKELELDLEKAKSRNTADNV